MESTTSALKPVMRCFPATTGIGKMVVEGFVNTTSPAGRRRKKGRRVTKEPEYSKEQPPPWQVCLIRPISQ